MKLLYLLIAAAVCACSINSDEENAGTNTDALYKVGVPSQDEKKVFIHYLPWFEDVTESEGHWADGTVNEPIIGYYDSKSWATHLYHILISAAAGIDGAMVNVNTDYDQDAFSVFVDSLERVREVYPAFDYTVSISVDDQEITVESAKAKFEYLKNEIISNYDTYLHKNNQPVIFIWMYDTLTPAQYRTIVDEVFVSGDSILIKNDIDTDALATDINMNSFYPWVKGFEDDGSDWGEEYLDWFYTTSLEYTQAGKQGFVVGAVWPGFDDREVSWGQGRWINRQDGGVYEDAWNKIDEYNVLWSQSVPTNDVSIDWLVIETWNDFNEGTEIEPVESNVDGESYRYLQLTADYIANYKDAESNIDAEQNMFIAAVKIYQAAKLIEDGIRDENSFYSILQSAIRSYLQADWENSLLFTGQIIGE